MPKPHCVKCETSFVMEKSDVTYIENFQGGKPYKIWSADLWRCPTCKLEILHGFGNKPLSEHWEDNFQEEFDKREKPFYHNHERGGIKNANS